MGRRFWIPAPDRGIGAWRGRSSLVIAVLSVTAACSGSEQLFDDSGHRGLPFGSVSDAATGGDFAVVFDVVSERDFTFADVQPPANGSPPTSPPAIRNDDYVGRVVHVDVDTVVWDDGERSTPSEFDFVTAGWQVRNGFRHAADDAAWHRVDVGQRYFGVFSELGGEIGPMSADAIYGMDGDRLVEVSAVGGPEPFDGATVGEVGALLQSASDAPPADNPP